MWYTYAVNRLLYRWKKSRVTHTVRACVRVRARSIFYERIYLWTAFLRCGGVRFSELLQPLVSFSYCIFIAVSIDPLLSAISQPFEAAVQNDLSRWHFDGETVGHCGLNKRFHNFIIFTNGFSFPSSSSLSFSPCIFPYFLFYFFFLFLFFRFMFICIFVLSVFLFYNYIYILLRFRGRISFRA